MSIVIIGGHDRMAGQYKEICKKYQCKAKVFTQMPSNFKNKIGNPDFLILFTSTVSHTMVTSAVQEATKNNIPIERSHSSSSCALKKILSCHCCSCTEN